MDESEKTTTLRDKRKQELKDTLISSARRLFVQHGFDAVSVDDIVTEAGVAKGTFYLYFKSKSELVEALIEENLAGLDETIAAAACVPAENPAETLLAVANVVIKQTAANAAFASIIYRRSSFLLTAERIIRKGMLCGAYREVDAPAAARVLRAIIAELAEHTDIPDITPEDIARSAIDYFERGIRSTIK